LLEGGGADEGAIAVKNNEAAGESAKAVLAAFDCVAGAELFGLLDVLDAGGLCCESYLLGLVADDKEDAFRRGNLEGGVDGVLNEGFASGAVEDFGHAAFHAGTLPGGEDHNGGWGLHLLFILANPWLPLA